MPLVITDKPQRPPAAGAGGEDNEQVCTLLAGVERLKAELAIIDYRPTHLGSTQSNERQAADGRKSVVPLLPYSTP
eukprot:SAG11_NODE_742_length_7408_cov_21.226023_5_plen_76_part_00